MNDKPNEMKSQTLDQDTPVNHGFGEEAKGDNNVLGQIRTERKTSDDIIEK